MNSLGVGIGSNGNHGFSHRYWLLSFLSSAKQQLIAQFDEYSSTMPACAFSLLVRQSFPASTRACIMRTPTPCACVMAFPVTSSCVVCKRTRADDHRRARRALLLAREICLYPSNNSRNSGIPRNWNSIEFRILENSPRVLYVFNTANSASACALGLEHKKRLRGAQNH